MRLPKSGIFQLFAVTLFFLVTACTARKPILQNAALDVGYEEQNLISNGDIEILDNGWPIGWDTNNDAASQGKCAIGLPGFQSDHALTISIEDANIHGTWNTKVINIKPHTRYTLSFWYRLPENGKLEVRLFGNSLPVTKMFRYNPMHWCRYSAIIDSGYSAGECQVSFRAQNGNGTFKFWIDQIELYEGESPIGKNCARLEYQYYNTAYVSPDIVSPLPFAFEWTFDDDQRPAEIQYIVEFPAEVEFISCALGRMCKWPPDGWHVTWTRPDYTSKVETERITINNLPYTRVIAHVPYVLGDQKQLTNNVVPVGIRDYWEGSLGRYSGMISLCLYVKPKITTGTFPFYYYTKWGKREQARKKLNLEVANIHKVESTKNLFLISEVQMQAGDKNPQLDLIQA